MKVAKVFKPPERREGAGFIIRDIFNSIPYEGPQGSDPFLMWHHLPRAYYKPGEMPGAPLHPHRGFYECPYAKTMISDKGAPEAKMLTRVVAGGVEHRGEMPPGGFELGKVGVGMEHEGLIDPRWCGELQFFQLWVNLPANRKFDPPAFQQMSPSVLPVVELAASPRATAKILHGSAFGATAPSTCEAVEWQYLDFELDPGARVQHTPPTPMHSRLLYVYEGAGKFGGTLVPEGHVAVLSKVASEELIAEAGPGGCRFVFVAGRPLGEPIVKHGPFVMTTRQQIQQCFLDYQCGKLCPEAVAYTFHGMHPHGV